MSDGDINGNGSLEEGDDYTFDVSKGHGTVRENKFCIVCAKRAKLGEEVNGHRDPGLSKIKFQSDSKTVCTPRCPGYAGHIPLPHLRKGSDFARWRSSTALVETEMQTGDVYDDATSDDIPLLLDGGMGNQQNLNYRNSEELNVISHCHFKLPSRSQATAKAKQKLIIATVLCLFFIAGEVAGGYLSHSLAIMSDAAHMLSDFAGFCVSLFSIWMSSKKPKKKFNYGYLRAEALGALFTLMILWCVTAILVWLAVNRLADTDSFEVEHDPMIIVAICAVVFNIILGLLLNGVPHIHGHSHGGSSHNHSHNRGAESHHDEEKHINVRAALIHVMGDLIQSIGVLISSIIIKLFPSAKIADPICTLLFSVIVMCTTATVFRDTVLILMESHPRSRNYDDIHDSLANMKHVVKIHDLRVWSLTVDQIALTVHLAVNPADSKLKEQILQEATNMLKRKFKIYTTTIQIEDFQAQIMNNCGTCNTIID